MSLCEPVATSRLFFQDMLTVTILMSLQEPSGKKKISTIDCSSWNDVSDKQGLLYHTVDGRNPAPVDMVNIPLFTGFSTSQVVVWDFWTINSMSPSVCLNLNITFKPPLVFVKLKGTWTSDPALSAFLSRVVTPLIFVKKKNVTPMFFVHGEMGLHVKPPFITIGVLEAAFWLQGFFLGSFLGRFAARSDGQNHQIFWEVPSLELIVRTWKLMFGRWGLPFEKAKLMLVSGSAGP